MIRPKTFQHLLAIDKETWELNTQLKTFFTGKICTHLIEKFTYKISLLLLVSLFLFFFFNSFSYLIHLFINILSAYQLISFHSDNVFKITAVFFVFIFLINSENSLSVLFCGFYVFLMQFQPLNLFSFWSHLLYLELVKFSFLLSRGPCNLSW